MGGVIYFVYQDIKIADWQDCIHSTVDKVDFSGAFALSRGNIDKISVLAGVPAGVSITTVLSFGREVSDKSIRLLTDSFRFSLGLNRTLPFRSLRWKTFKFVAIYSVLKTRAQMTAASICMNSILSVLPEGNLYLPQTENLSHLKFLVFWLHQELREVKIWE